jgi:hypothetical protein
MGPSVGSGIAVASGAGLTLKNSELRGLSANALDLAGTASLETVLMAETGNGIVMLSSGADLTLHHATVANATGVGVDNSACGTALIEHSILYGNTGGDLIGEACTSVNWSVVGSVMPSVGGDNLQVDPQFVGGGDYRLQSGSAALDHGPDPATYLGIPCRDLDDDLRLRDHDGDGIAKIDPGAYERANGTLVPDEVANLRVTPAGFFEWDAEGSASEYHVYRGALSSLGYGDFGSCEDSLDSDLTDTLLNDLSEPPSGDGYFYMITADDTAGTGGAEGTRGLGVCAERTAFTGTVCP